MGRSFIFETEKSVMLIENILQIIFVIFICIIPLSLLILVWCDVREFIEEIRNIHKK